MADGSGVSADSGGEGIEALSASERRFRLFADTAADVIFSYSTGTNAGFEYLSPAVLPITGYSADELRADPAVLGRVLPGVDLDAVIADLRDALEGGRSYQVAITRKNGTPCHLDVTLRRVSRDGWTGVEGIARDVTQRVEVEQALVESERRFRHLAENARDVLFRYRKLPLPKVEYVSPGVAALTGYPPEAFYADPQLKLRVMHPEDLAALRLKMESTRDPYFTSQVRWLRKDGSIAISEHCARLVRNAQGAVEIIESVTRDVTEQRRAEQSLRTSEQNLRAVIEHLPDAVAIGRDSRYVFVNRAFEQLSGYSRGELLTKSPAELSPPGQDGAPVEVALPRKDGERRTCEMTSLGLDLDGGHSTLILLRDLTEHRAIQARMMLSDRMASLGTLAAGVAHEINNPLAYAIANTAWVTQELREMIASGESPGASRLTELLAALMDALDGQERVKRIVRDMRTFAHEEGDASAPVDLRRVVETSISMSSNEIRHRARLVRDFEHVPEILGNEARLGQVFLNLLINAAQAMEAGHAERNEIRVTLRPRPGDGATVTVQDTGRGVSPQDLPRIFDPFFTTKPVGEGTGMGLAVCHAIVTSHGGTIRVDSKPGVGTTVVVELPARPSASPAPPEIASAERLRVLVIDDEPAVGMSIKRLLQRHHDVEVTTSARDALDRLAAGASWDLVFCDVMMPEVTGVDLYDILARTEPAMLDKLVFVTGGAFTDTVRRFLDSNSSPRVAKPFTQEDLLGAMAVITAKRAKS